MLVPPQIVSRPGDNGSPSGACQLSGASHPNDGPYALVLGSYFSKKSIIELARAFGGKDILADEAQEKIESLVKEVARGRDRIQSATEDRETLHAEIVSLRGQLGAAKSENKLLKAELADTRTLHDVASEFLGGKSTRRLEKVA